MTTQNNNYVGLTYQQFRHLNMFMNTGDFTIETLEKEKQITLTDDKSITCKFKDLQMEDGNILWTKSTRNTLEIPLGISFKTKSIETVLISNESKNLVIEDYDKNIDLINSIILNSLFSYSSGELILCGSNLNDSYNKLENIISFDDEESLDKFASEESRRRHHLFIDNSCYSFKEYRKENNLPAILIILNREVDRRKLYLINSHGRYGIYVMFITDNYKYSLSSSFENIKYIKFPKVTKCDIENDMNYIFNFSKKLGENKSIELI